MSYYKSIWILFFLSIFSLSGCSGGSSDETPVTVDTVKPELTLLGDAEVTVMQGESYADAGATASDAVDGNITSKIVEDGYVDTSVAGTYELTYSVSDAAGNSATVVKRTVTVSEKWTLVWNDEFDDNVVDPGKWAYMLGDGTLYGETAGWGNQELQFYTDDQANSGITQDDQDSEDGSVLYISARNDADNQDYTSAKLTTEDLFEFRFGRVEARIKVPGGKGMWPAFWTLGANKPDIGWPGSGEIDIMEVIGMQEQNLHGTLHFVDASNGHDSDGGIKTLAEGKFSDGYHLYAIEWTPEKIAWMVDGEKYAEVAIADDMKEFLREHYLILNLAVGGDWPGNPDETTGFPKQMLVDYVRVYEDSTLQASEAPVLVVEEETMGLASSVALAAINSSFAPFQDVKIVTYGPGSPEPARSTTAYEGGSSISAVYPGGKWGGIYFELDPVIDASEYANGYLVAMLSIPDEFAEVEIKLEGASGQGPLNLMDYTPEPVDEVFAKYRIPLADFVAAGTVFSDLKVPFSLWNPKDASGSLVAGDVLIDNIYFELEE